MKIALASDHAGFDYKHRLEKLLRAGGHEVVDFGTDSPSAVDYPDVIRPAAKAVASGHCQQGIVLGGSGNGEAMVANRIRGIRCAVCWNAESARLAREHNDANMISIGQRLVEWDTAEAIVSTWLETTFASGRHLRRIEKIDEGHEDHLFSSEVTPVLAVSSIQHTAEWYGNVLGFRVVPFLDAPGSQVVILQRGSARIVLKYDPCFKPRLQHGISFYFSVHDVRDLFEAVKCHGHVSIDLRKRPYGDVVFQVTDCNGYGLIFGESR